jgi:prolyl oligopeptidase
MASTYRVVSASRVVVSLVLGLGLGLGSSALAKPPAYPAAERGTVVEDLHGVKVADPYRWLEDPDAPRSQEWIKEENAITYDYLAGVPQRDKIKQRITELWNFERWGVPFKEGGKYFVTRNDGLQNQAPLFVMDKLTGEPRLLLDPKEFKADGTAAIAGTAVTEDGKLMAYGIADGGSDWNTWRVRDVATAKDLPDVIEWVKFSSASWMKDGSGFFYSRYDKPADGKALRDATYFHKVYFHKMGTTQESDQLVYERPDQPTWGLGAFVTDDGKYLCLSLSDGTENKNRFYVRDLAACPLSSPPAAGDKAIVEAERAVRQNSPEPGTKAAPGAVDGAKQGAADAARKRLADLIKANGNASLGFVQLLNDFDAQYDCIGNDGSLFYFVTDLEAPRRRVMMIDVSHPEKANWKTVIAEAPETLEGCSYVGGHLLASYLKDAHTLVKVYSPAGKFVRDVELPGIGTAGGFGGRQKDTETFYSYTAYTTPTTIYHYDIAGGKSDVFRQPKVGFDPGLYTTEQVFYTSKDGTKIPMFISYKKGIKKDGSNPTLLYGYGGFNIPMTPGFSVGNLAWMEMGGIYAVANLRGGGEYGAAWHDAGRLNNKQNVFDDFISAAEWLIKEKYTSTPRLAIHGGSNGGLLVGACLVQRPDLYGAALPAVGVLDMLRFHKFTCGWEWCSDYGSPDDAAGFKTLYKYSPYHNVKDGACYPPTMILTADHDDRVVPAHSFKFAAALQHAQKCDNPILIRIDVRAGHGAGKPTKMIIEQIADQWSFLVRALNMQVN